MSSPLVTRRNGKKQACEPCRRRKVACDHGYPICRRCRKRPNGASACHYASPEQAATPFRARPSQQQSLQPRHGILGLTMGYGARLLREHHKASSGLRAFRLRTKRLRLVWLHRDPQWQSSTRLLHQLSQLHHRWPRYRVLWIWTKEQFNLLSEYSKPYPKSLPCIDRNLKLALMRTGWLVLVIDS
ncbi:hypothetical protein LB505_008338 [Fusarium chuoi]|nr:hypothetical protein LB505_008338 [Fusarium chuoi]